MASPFVGRWDLTVGTEHTFPSWLELIEEGGSLSGRFVGVVGSARPIARIQVIENELRFSLPPQYEGFLGDMVFAGKLEGDVLVGTTNTELGGEIDWVGVPAPAFDVPQRVAWGDPVDLVSVDLVGWQARWPDMPNHWANMNGTLQNTAKGTDLVSDARFGDFKLLAHYSYPEGSNSGIYLRGRYEFQVLDDFGAEPSVGGSGAIYGFLKPASNAVRPFGDINVAEITLVGRTISVVLNGVTIYDQVEIPGITGGALDSREGDSGPILIQGDHGPVMYHVLRVSPRLD